jgi:hypothetical protein
LGKGGEIQTLPGLVNRLKWTLGTNVRSLETANILTNPALWFSQGLTGALPDIKGTVFNSLSFAPFRRPDANCRDIELAAERPYFIDLKVIPVLS